MHDVEMPEITPAQLKAQLDASDAPYLLDVREPAEHDICHLPGSILVPMSTLADEGPAALPADLKDQSEIVVYCKLGGRSARITGWLMEQGYSQVKNLVGGIQAWAEDIDPDMPTY